MSNKVKTVKISETVTFSVNQAFAILLSSLINTVEVTSAASDGPKVSITEEERKQIEELVSLLHLIDSLSFEATKTSVKASYRILLTDKEEAKAVGERLNFLLSLPLAREVVIQFFLPKEAPKKTSIRRSGQYNDQLLKYDFPEENKNKQLRLWDGLSDKMKREITAIGIEKEEAVQRVVEGIRLTSTETKLVDAILQLLHELSERQPDSKNYYTGNLPAKVINNGDAKEVAPVLSFTDYQLAKYYKGGGSVSGKTVENVEKTLRALSNKYFAINYTKTTKLKDGRSLKEKIQRFAKIIEIMSYEAELEGADKVSRIIVQLHPIFRDQIDTKWIEYPSDITRRTEIAYGSSHISKETLRLRDFLMSQRANKDWTTSIYLEKLYYKLADREMKSSKQKRVADKTNKALETVKTLGLLKDYKVEIGKTGEKLVVLEIDKDWS